MRSTLHPRPSPSGRSHLPSPEPAVGAPRPQRLAFGFQLLQLLAPRNRRVQRSFLVLAAIFFVAGIAYSLHREPGILARADWSLVPWVALLVIPTILVNGVRFLLMARSLEMRFSTRRAMEISVISSAANLLPIPGGTLVRLANLKSPENRYRDGVWITFWVAALWSGVTVVYSGLWVIRLANGWTGSAFVLAGLSVATVSLIRIRARAGSTVTVALLGVEFATVLLDAIRLHLCLEALGAASGFGQASVLTVSAVAGSAVGIVPAGLGVRELVSAAVSPLVHLAPELGFLSASLNRMVGLTTIAPVAVWLALRRSRSA